MLSFSLSLSDSSSLTTENNIIHILQIIRAWDFLLLYSSIRIKLIFVIDVSWKHIFLLEPSSVPVSSELFFCFLKRESMIMEMREVGRASTSLQQCRWGICRRKENVITNVLLNLYDELVEVFHLRFTCFLFCFFLEWLQVYLYHVYLH